MVEKNDLAVTVRTAVGKANKRLVREGLIPGNISGHGQSSQAVQLESLAFKSLKRNHTLTGVIRLTQLDAPGQMVLIRHVQHNAVSNKVIHVDFTRVAMDERISSKAPLRFGAESAQVKILGGVLLHLLDTLDIDCPASDIAEYIEVDISGLTTIDATLYARDIKLPENYRLITPADEAVAKIAATRAALNAETEAEVATATEAKA